VLSLVRPKAGQPKDKSCRKKERPKQRRRGCKRRAKLQPRGSREKSRGESASHRFQACVEWDTEVRLLHSAWGMVTGSQEHQNAGNLKAEQGEWKSSLADGTVPVPSMDRVKAKVER
jgi:hypothetical protein